MSQELVYTSAPKGLKLGSRGFCTVASTTGMAKNLADRLEALTGYKHLFPPDSPQAVENPVNYSYLRFALGGQTYYVLSRIADAGLDYTQRSNKLAHHVVLSQTELVSAGPAWLASQPGVFETEWHKEPQLFSNGRHLPSGDLPAGICGAWQAATGDAGWAGVLAEHALKNASEEAYLVYKPGTDVLKLFQEAQALLPLEVRWDTTFSTYFTKLPPGIECRWRGVVDGTPEALRARRLPNTLAIALTEVLPIAPDGRLVRIARRGGTSSSNDAEPGQVIDGQRLVPTLPSQRNIGSERKSGFDTPAIQPPALPNRRGAGWNSSYRAAGLSRRERAIWGTCILILIGAFASTVVYLTRSSVQPQAQVGTIDDTVKGEPAVSNHTIGEEAKPPVPSVVTSETLDSNPDTRSVEPHDDSLTGPVGGAQVTDVESVHQEVKAAALPNPSDALPSADNEKSDVSPIGWDSLQVFSQEVPLPPISQSMVNEAWKKPVPIATFTSQPPLELSLLSSDDKSQEWEILIDRTDNSHHWDVLARKKDGTSVRLALIEFADSELQLQFRWTDDAKKLSSLVTDTLRGSVLRLKLDEISETKFVSFLPIDKSEVPLRLDANELTNNTTWTFPVTKDNRIPKGQSLSANLRLTPTNLFGEDILSLTADQSQAIRLSDSEFELDIQFKVAAIDRPSMVLSLMVTDEHTKERISYNSWRRKMMLEKKQLLTNAIVSYIRPADQIMLMHLRELGFPVHTVDHVRASLQTTETVEKVQLGDIRGYLKNKPRRFLAEKEYAVRLLSAPNGPWTQEHDRLQQHEERIAQLESAAKQFLSSAEMNLRVTRKLTNLADQLNPESPQIVVLIRGTLK